MFLNKLDYLSPIISIYYKGNLYHSSIGSGIMSIITVVAVINLGVYFSLDIINRENPNTFFYNSFIEYPGTYNVDSKSLFHFLANIKVIRGKWDYPEFDFGVYNIIGFQGPVDNYIATVKNNRINYTAHWLYGYCNKDKYGEEINKLTTNYTFFEKSACISKYYDPEDLKYYDIGDPKFIWPSIANGTFSEENKVYGLYLQKRDNKIIKSISETLSCKSENEVKEFFTISGSLIFGLHFLNNNINALDYAHCYKSFFYKIMDTYKKDFYTLTEINISPTKVRTFNGLIIDKYEDDVSYIFENKIQSAQESSGNNLYAGFTFYLQNIMNYYERRYKKIQDVISDIGGCYQVVSIVAIFLNKIYNNFIVLIDTEKLVSSLINSEKKIIRNSKKNLYELKPKIMYKEKGNITSNTVMNTEKTRDQLNKNKSYDIQKNDAHLINNKKKKKNKVGENVDLDRLETLRKTRMEHNFWSYLKYRLPFNKQKYNFEIYEKFRIKILSEEHLVRNHLNTYNLLKVTEKKRLHKKSTFHLNNLMNMI